MTIIDPLQMYGQCPKCGGANRLDHSCLPPFLIGRADDWMPIESAPKDGSHILVCLGPYSETWTFNQAPPAVVHWWNEPGEEGFYLSCGDQGYPYKASHWKQLGEPPKVDAAIVTPFLDPAWVRKVTENDEPEPEGCSHCGLIAGCCSSFPNCPGGDVPQATHNE